MSFDHGRYVEKIRPYYDAQDPGHDWAHIQRVVKTATELALAEGARLEVVVPAAYLHDIVNVPKDHPERARASTLAADKALKILSDAEYPQEYFAAIHSAIEEHSFSRGLTPTTIEGACVQDADRLDAIGAIGVLRCCAVSLSFNSQFYDVSDPWAQRRSHDDKRFMIDHYETKLLKLAATLQTSAAKAEGERRTHFMRAFLDQLRSEISS